MARIGNESKLILKLARERMKAKHLEWLQLSSSPNASSNDPTWLAGWEYAYHAWEETLTDVVIELEK